MAKLGPTTIYGSINVTGVTSLTDVIVETLNGATIGTIGTDGTPANPVIPIIKTDGSMDVGRAIDFHASDGSSTDYDARLDMTSADTLELLSTDFIIRDGMLTLSDTVPVIELFAETNNSNIKFRSRTAGQDLQLRHDITDTSLPAAGQALVIENISDNSSNIAHLVVEGRVYANRNQRVFADDYHPNADKWTTARTLTLSGDTSGSVSFDGSSNAVLSVTVTNDSHTHDTRYYTKSQSDTRFVNVTGDSMTGDLTVDAGQNSAVNVICDDNGVALVSARGTGQGNGRIFVGQSSEYGGGIEYVGDATPPGSGAGSDNIVLFRKAAGAEHWTARNSYNNNNWEFRGDVKAPSFTGNASSATKLKTARTISLTGNATGSATFDGSANASISVNVNRASLADKAVINTSFNGQYPMIVNVNGLLYSNTKIQFNGEDGKLIATGPVEGDCLGVGNRSNSSGKGVSLYAGSTSGMPTYGIAFAGTTFGKYGWVTGDWATYLTMNNTAGRGWILKGGTSSVFSVDAVNGNVMAKGAIGLGSDTSRFMRRDSTEGSWQFHSDNGKTWIFGARNTSWIHNSTTATSGFYYYQQIQSASNITAYSDRRVKSNIEIIPDALDKVCKLNGYTFDRTDMECARQTGVIAQEVQEVLPEAVVEAGGDEDGHLAVAYGNMVGLLIEAIKEQQKQIDELKNAKPTPWWKRLFK